MNDFYGMYTYIWLKFTKPFFQILVIEIETRELNLVIEIGTVINSVVFRKVLRVVNLRSVSKIYHIFGGINAWISV